MADTLNKSDVSKLLTNRLVAMYFLCVLMKLQHVYVIQEQVSQLNQTKLVSFLFYKADLL